MRIPATVARPRPLSRRLFLALAGIAVLSAGPTPAAAASGTAASQPRVLVYTRNGPTLDGKKGFVHDNIATSVAAIRKLGEENGFAVDASEDPKVFTDANLKQYRAIVFSNSNNTALDTAEQKAAFQRYIRAGGGFAGIHSASGSERAWPWYWALLGGTFDHHPKMQAFTILVTDRKHPSTAHIGEKWVWTDEFYFHKDLSTRLHVLLEGDLNSLTDPKKPAGRATYPLAWCQEFEGGRSWFTALGHKKEHYADPVYLRHLLGGIKWAMGAAK